MTWNGYGVKAAVVTKNEIKINKSAGNVLDHQSSVNLLESVR
jgi:hypothetical protein